MQHSCVQRSATLCPTEIFATDPYPNRDIHCQEALEDAFIELTERGVEAGWVQIEALQALLELANSHLLRGLATESDDDNIATVIRSMREDDEK